MKNFYKNENLTKISQSIVYKFKYTVIKREIMRINKKRTGLIVFL